MTHLDLPELPDLLYVLRESQIKVTYALHTLSKYLFLGIFNQLILIAFLLARHTDPKEDPGQTLILIAMFAATALFLCWGLFVVPYRLKAILKGDIAAPTESQ
jgi:hypothetical protein